MKKDKPDPNSVKGISRRNFLKGFGITTVGAAVFESGQATKNLKAAGLLNVSDSIPIEGAKMILYVNSKEYSVHIKPKETLAEVLREKLELTGTKTGCERGSCGACTVLIDDNPVNSCMFLAVDAVGKQITTIEGVASDENLHILQNEFIENDALQCGFCTPGMIMSSLAIIKKNPAPDDEYIRKNLSGNLCRCGTYPKVFQAVIKAAKG
ncbi:MAG: (2Fe-2S)-binding protein [Ignavibacteriales bacterium]|nr:(2Fe-2S)-binding protein [Ignavibacteriales bacterium]